MGELFKRCPICRSEAMYALHIGRVGCSSTDCLLYIVRAKFNPKDWNRRTSPGSETEAVAALDRLANCSPEDCHYKTLEFERDIATLRGALAAARGDAS